MRCIAGSIKNDGKGLQGGLRDVEIRERETKECEEVQGESRCEEVQQSKPHSPRAVTRLSTRIWSNVVVELLANGPNLSSCG